jgi:hypothetical protein
MKIIGNILRLFHPGWGYCKKCHYPWKFRKDVSINYYRSYGIYNGYFALCEKCWNKTTLEEKIKYYTEPIHINSDKQLKKNMIYNILKLHNIDEKTYYRNKKLERILNERN